MKSILTACILILALPALAEDAPDLPTPEELAAGSDYIVLARLQAYDYEERRDIPVEGKTWFEVLVPYKVPSPTDTVRVIEEGFGEGKCYFDHIPLYEEMPRFLLFLVEDDNGNLRGHPDGCAIPLLVTTDNHYVVRWPVDTIELPEEAEALVQEFEFHGTAAFVDLGDLTRHRRERRIEKDHLAKVEDGKRGQYRYTRGILLEDFRPFLGAENMTRDRIQRGR